MGITYTVFCSGGSFTRVTPAGVPTAMPAERDTECAASRQWVSVSGDATSVECPVCGRRVRVHRWPGGTMIATHNGERAHANG